MSNNIGIKPLFWMEK